MSGSNSHSMNGNGHPRIGGTGALHADLDDHNRQRGTAKMLERAIRNGWLIPEEAPKELPKRIYDAAVAAAQEGNHRTLATMAEILRRMEADNVGKLAVTDKIERLDTGGVTERHEHLLPPDARARVNRLTELLGNADDR